MGEIGSLVEVSATDKLNGSLTIVVYHTTQNHGVFHVCANGATFLHSM